MCGSAETAEVDVLDTKYDSASMILSVQFKPLAVRSGAKLCIDSVHVANLDVIGEGCLFKTADSRSPCLSQACDEPTSEACLQLTMEYCAHRVDDEACALFVPTFAKDKDVQASVSLNYPGVAASATVRFVPASCACGSACSAEEVQVVGAKTSVVSALLTTEIIPLRRGVFKMCVSASGSTEVSAYSDHAANIHVSLEKCAFDASDGESPCTAEACQGENAFSEECVNAVVEIGRASCRERV